MKDRFACPFGEVQHCILTQAAIRLGLIPDNVLNDKAECLQHPKKRPKHVQRREQHADDER